MVLLAQGEDHGDDSSTADDVEAWVDMFDIEDRPVLSDRDASTVSALLDREQGAVMGYPTFFLLDREQEIVDRYTGTSSGRVNEWLEGLGVR